MLKLSIFVLLYCFAAAVGVQAQITINRPVQINPNVLKINDQPQAMQKDCKAFLGRAQQSLCSSEQGYNACLAYLKDGKWDYCIYTGNEKMRARRSTKESATADLLTKHCVKAQLGAAAVFQCPDGDYLLSTAYLDCIAYQNGTPGIGCAPPFSLMDIYADKIVAKLKGNPVGFAFVVTNKKGGKAERAWGVARKSPDVNPMSITTDSEYSLASVSKNISAAALMHVLTAKNISVSKGAKQYFPKNWTVNESFTPLTFQDLLTHRSGIRCDYPGDVTFENLKKCIEAGVNYNDRGKDCNGNALTDNNSIGCYSNYNYALLRILIPRVNGFSDDTVANPGEKYSQLYRDYVNVNVFAKAGFGAFCRPTEGANQPLVYKLAAPKGKGGDFGNMDLVCASQGWFLSAKRLSSYFYRLNYSEAILPKWASEQMREKLLGYTNRSEYNTKFGRLRMFWHSGYHPASMNPGEINTMVINFSNGIQIAFIMNSDTPASVNYGTVLTESMLEAMELN